MIKFRSESLKRFTQNDLLILVIKSFVTGMGYSNINIWKFLKLNSYIRPEYRVIMEISN